MISKIKHGIVTILHLAFLPVYLVLLVVIIPIGILKDIADLIVEVIGNISDGLRRWAE